MNTKRATLLLIILSLLLSLTGCQTAKVGTQPSTVVAGSNHDPVRFAFDDPPFWRDQANRLEDTVAVDYQVVPFTSLRQKVSTSFLSGSCDLDVVHIHEMWMAEWASQGYLEPLENHLNLSSLEADYPQSAILKMTGPDGKLHTYGLGLYVWINSLYYRTDIVPKPPKTYDELIEQATKYHQPDLPGLMVALGGTSASSLFGTILRTYGGEILTQGKPSFNNAAGLSALNQMVRMVPLLAPVSFSQMSSSKTSEDYVAGGSVFAIAPPPTLILAANPDKSKVRDSNGKLLIAPALMPGGPAQPSATYSENGSRAITACSDRKDQAVRYIEAVTTSTEMKSMALSLGRIPARLSVLNDPEVQAKYPLIGVVAKQLQYPAGMTVVHPKGTEINTALANQILRALHGEISPQQALDQAEKEILAITNQ